MPLQIRLLASMHAHAKFGADPEVGSRRCKPRGGARPRILPGRLHVGPCVDQRAALGKSGPSTVSNGRIAAPAIAATLSLHETVSTVVPRTGPCFAAPTFASYAWPRALENERGPRFYRSREG